METIIRGALAGLAATAPMTAVLGMGRLTGWLHTPPPAQITANVAVRAGESPQPEDPLFQGRHGSPRTSPTARPVAPCMR
jgi:hypothetical protein